MSKCGGAESRYNLELGAEKNGVWMSRASVPRYVKSRIGTQTTATYSVKDIVYSCTV